MCPSVAVEDASLRKTPIPDCLLYGLYDKIGFHVLGHGMRQFEAADYVFDDTEILESLTGPDIADVTDEDLKRLRDIYIANVIDISFASRLTAVGQGTLSSAPVDRDKAFGLHDTLNALE